MVSMASPTGATMGQLHGRHAKAIPALGEVENESDGDAFNAEVGRDWAVSVQAWRIRRNSLRGVESDFETQNRSAPRFAWKSWRAQLSGQSGRQSAQEARSHMPSAAALA